MLQIVYASGSLITCYRYCTHLAHWLHVTDSVRIWLTDYMLQILYASGSLITCYIYCTHLAHWLDGTDIVRIWLTDYMLQIVYASGSLICFPVCICSVRFSFSNRVERVSVYVTRKASRAYYFNNIFHQYSGGRKKRSIECKLKM